jgi:hypothetical protein
MSKDKACISAVKEVCQRCHLYKENCGMLDYPDQCIASGRYIDGYHQAEKDLELTVDDIKNIDRLLNQCVDCSNPYQEVLKRFNTQKGK